MVDAAISSPNKCIAAITHSTYIRIMLAMLMDTSLPLQPVPASSTKMMQLEQSNCCINVIDLRVQQQQHHNNNNMNGNNIILSRQNNSNFLGGGGMNESRVTPHDYQLTVPKSKVLRINENRHLLSLCAHTHK